MYLGIDIGSVSIKCALVSEESNIKDMLYFRTNGDVISALKKLLKELNVDKIKGIGVTGSGRSFVSALIEADLSVDEITAHRTAVFKLYPNVKTIFEIGGQDSKLIYNSKNNLHFEMNNACAAGTGSFLDQQASRLGLDIVSFYKKGLKAKKHHSIASKCTVFAESDMIHAQQSGIPEERIIRGVHKGLIDNYYSQLCQGKILEGDFLFEGATSENDLLVQELNNRLRENNLLEKENSVIVPKPYNKNMGAIGAAMICIKRNIKNLRDKPKISNYEFLDSDKCYDCPNRCGAEILKAKINNRIIIMGRPCEQ